MSEQMADVGVVFVHGIGEQLHGETVAEYGEALAGYVERAVAEGGEATLEIDRDDPTITLALTNANTSSSIEVSEAWWAEDFERPDLSSVVKWSALLAPWIVTREAAYSWERLEGFSILAGLLPEEGSRRKAAMTVLFAALYITGVLRLMMTVLRGVAFMLGGVILQIALVILFALSYVHVPGLRRAVRWIHHRLTGSIGDAYAFLAIDDSSEDIASAALAGIAAAAARCERLVVVAHSQGAAVVHRLVADRRMPHNLARLITLGPGIAKLSVIGMSQHERRRLRLGILLRYAVIATAVIVAAVLAALGTTYTVDGSSPLGAALDSEGSQRPAWMMVPLVAGLIGLLLAYLARFVASRRLPAQLVDLPGAGRSWIWTDLWASHDLVPDGKLPIPKDTGLSIKIFNHGSLLVDHVTYHRNVEVLDLLADAVDRLLPENAARLNRGDTTLERLVRERYRRASRKRLVWVAVPIAAFLVLGLATRPLVLTVEVLGSPEPSTLGVALTTMVIVAMGPLLAGVFVFAGGALFAGVLAWRRWHQKASRLEIEGWTVPMLSRWQILDPRFWIRLPAMRPEGESGWSAAGVDFLT